jgi:hypothetical protein
MMNRKCLRSLCCRGCNECFKEAARSVVIERFRMPLHTDHKRKKRMFDPLDEPIGCVCIGSKDGGDVFDGLMMKTIRGDMCIQNDPVEASSSSR